MDQEEFLRDAQGAAQNAGHVFPDYAACEAALESAYGRSRLAVQGNNLFGQKRGIYTAQYPSISINTWEVIDGKNVTVPADWVVFPDWDTCFKERMALLKRKSIYASALAAQDGETFVREVSGCWEKVLVAAAQPPSSPDAGGVVDNYVMKYVSRWGTDPHRADKVIAIHEIHKDLFA